jgi:CDP-glucose 4,6-dehydratase
MTSFWHGRRVLVTGHTGFKGAWLALWLHALGAEVTGFSGPPPSEPSLFEAARLREVVDDRRGDVCDREAVERTVRDARPEVVFHLAARAIVRAAVENAADTYAVNVVGTAHVLKAAQDSVSVCVTSDKCYAPGPRPHREGDPLGGDDPYSASKAAQELVAAAHREAYGARVATARAGNVIGGGDWGRDRLLPDLVRARESGTPVVLRHPDAVRPWQHVLDPLAGYLLLAERLHGSAEWATAFNFGPDEARPVSWVVKRVRERWSLDVRVEPPGDAIEAPALRLDASAARKRLGWAPRHDLASGLDATVSWYDEVRAGGDARAVTLTQIEETT